MNRPSEGLNSGVLFDNGARRELSVTVAAPQHFLISLRFKVRRKQIVADVDVHDSGASLTLAART